MRSASTRLAGISRVALPGTPVGGTFSLTSDAVAVGAKLHQSLYEELLEPQVSSSASLLSFDVGSPDSSGYTGVDAYANDVYEYTGSNGSSAPSIGTVTVSPKVSSTGISEKSFTVKKVNPFVALSSTVQELPDEDDYGLVNTYRVYRTHSYSFHGPDTQYIHAMNDNTGAEVFLNDNVASGTLSGAFSTSVSTSSHSSSSHVCAVNCGYTLSESALSDHKGGLVELKAYVENQHSLNRLRRTYATFGIYVHGAIGARMSGIGTNVVEISTAWCGNEASYGFGSVEGVNLIEAGYANGDMFSYIPNTVVNNIPVGGSALGSRVYQLQREGATLDNSMTIMEAESPRFKFRTVGSVGVFVTGDGLSQGYYYLQPSGTPTVDGHGYYVLHLLGDIQDKASLTGPKQGWLLD